MSSTLSQHWWVQASQSPDSFLWRTCFNQSTLLLKYKFNIEVLIQDFIAYFKQGQNTSNTGSKPIYLFGDTSDRECLRYKYCKASGLANTLTFKAESGRSMNWLTRQNVHAHLDWSHENTKKEKHLWLKTPSEMQQRNSEHTGDRASCRRMSRILMCHLRTVPGDPIFQTHFKLN